MISCGHFIQDPRFCLSGRTIRFAEIDNLKTVEIGVFKNTITDNVY